MKYTACVRCQKNIELVIRNFISDKTGLCKKCTKRVYNLKNVDKVRAWKRKAYEKKILDPNYREKENKYVRDLYKTPEGKLKMDERYKRYRLKHPERVKAWNAVSYKKIEHKPCQVCGKEKTHRHHPDPQQKLLIIHLCPKHHALAHSKPNQIYI